MDDEQIRKLVDPRFSAEERMAIYQSLLVILRSKTDSPERITHNIIAMLNDHLEEKYKEMTGAALNPPKGKFRRVDE